MREMQKPLSKDFPKPWSREMILRPKSNEKGNIFLAP